MYDIYSKLWDGENINIEYYRELINKDPDEVSVAEYEALMMMFDKVAEDMASEDTDIRERAINQMDALLNSSYTDGHAVGTRGSGTAQAPIFEWALSPVIGELGKRYTTKTFFEMDGKSGEDIVHDKKIQGDIFTTNLFNSLPKTCYGYPSVNIEISGLTRVNGSRYSSYTYSILIDRGRAIPKDNILITAPYMKGDGYTSLYTNTILQKMYDDNTPTSVSIATDAAGFIPGSYAVSAGINVAGIAMDVAGHNETNTYVTNASDAETLLHLYSKVGTGISMTVTSDGKVKIGPGKINASAVSDAVKEYNDKPNVKENSEWQIDEKIIISILNGTCSQETWDKYTKVTSEKSILSEFLNG
jgi:hypothetical protein